MEALPAERRAVRGAESAVTAPSVLSPSSLVVLAPGLTLVASFLVETEAFPDLWGQPYRLNGRHFALSVGGVLLVWAGAKLAAGRRPIGDAGVHRNELERLHRVAVILYRVVLLAYAIWAGVGLARGLGLAQVMAFVGGEQGAAFRLKTEFLAPVGGVTTWTQFAPVVAAICVLLIRFDSGGSAPQRMLWTIGGLSLLRALLMSERLAVIEVLLAGIFAWMLTSHRLAEALRKPVRRVAYGLVAAASVYLLFGVFEYFRSWSSFYRHVYDGGFWEFTFYRLAGYYATAYNNAALVEQSTFIGNKELLLLGGDFKVPGLLDPVALPAARNAYQVEMIYSSNLEFNNLSGLLLPLIVLPVILGSLLLFLLGATFGWMWRRLMQGSLVAVVAYSSLVVGILEHSRFFYFASSRAVPVYIAIAVLVMWRTVRKFAAPGASLKGR